MRKYEKYIDLLWSEDDEFTVAIYDQFNSMIWKPEEIFLIEDLVEWNKIDSSIREIIVEGVVFYKAISQLIGLECIPKLVSSSGETYMARQSVLSSMQARITGAHSIISTRMIRDMNTSFLIEKVKDRAKSRQGMEGIMNRVVLSYESLLGWSMAYNLKEDNGSQDFDIHEELNYSLWQVCAISAVLMEASTALPVSLLFQEMESGIYMPETLKAWQVIIRDTTIISTYFARLAKSKMEVMTKEKQEEAKTWINDSISDIYDVLWAGVYSEIEIQSVSRVYDVVQLNQYNINKVLDKMGLDLVYDVVEMPDLVEKYLGVPTNKDIITAYKKKEAWFKWKK